MKKNVVALTCAIILAIVSIIPQGFSMNMVWAKDSKITSETQESVQTEFKHYDMYIESVNDLDPLQDYTSDVEKRWFYEYKEGESWNLYNSSYVEDDANGGTNGLRVYKYNNISGTFLRLGKNVLSLNYANATNVTRSAIVFRAPYTGTIEVGLDNNGDINSNNAGKIINMSVLKNDDELIRVNKTAVGNSNVTSFSEINEDTNRFIQVQEGDKIRFSFDVSSETAQMIWNFKPMVTYTEVESIDTPLELPLNEMSATAGSEQIYNTTEGNASFAIDGNFDTIWHTKWDGGAAARDLHYITIDLGKVYDINTLKQYPRPSITNAGVIKKYKVQVSKDNQNFTTVSQGEWQVTKEWHDASVETLVPARYVRLVSVTSTTDATNLDYTSVAEIRIVGKTNDVAGVDMTQVVNRKLDALIQNDGYTPNSYQPYLAARNMLDTIITSTTVNQEEVNKAVTNYDLAVAGLLEKADCTELNNQITIANTKLEFNYAADSWTNFITKRDIAISIAANENATQQEVDTARTELVASMEALVIVGTKYNITLKKTDNCTVELGELDRLEGEIVSIVHNGQTKNDRLKKLEVYYLDEQKVRHEITVTDGNFIMPAAEVTVDVVYTTLTNVIRGKTLNGTILSYDTATGDYNISGSTERINCITDGITDSNDNSFCGIGGSANIGVEASKAYIQLDLGAAYDIDRMNMWRYLDRTYAATVIQTSLSSDFSNPTTVYNSDDTNGSKFGLGAGSDTAYAETSEGKEITFSTHAARYLRIYMSGQTSTNGWNHLIELQVWGDASTASYALNKEITGSGEVTIVGDRVSAKSGETVEVSATPEPGFILKGITVTGPNAAEVIMTGSSFTMPEGDVTIQAVFVQGHEVQFYNQGQMVDTINYEDGVGMVRELPQLTRAGYVFKGWFSSDYGEGNTAREEITDYATIQKAYAQWDKGYTITVAGGTYHADAIAGTSEDTPLYRYNTPVTLHAEATSDAGAFKGWKLNGVLVTTECDYTFYVTKDLHFAAEYGNTVETLSKGVRLDDVVIMESYMTTGKRNIRFYGQTNILKDIDVIEAGLVWTTDAGKQEQLEVNSIMTGIRTSFASKVSNIGQFSVTITGVPLGTELYGKLFVKYRNSQGIVDTAYLTSNLGTSITTAN